MVVITLLFPSNIALKSPFLLSNNFESEKYFFIYFHMVFAFDQRYVLIFNYKIDGEGFINNELLLIPVRGSIIMDNFNIKIDKKLRRDAAGNLRTEIWAEILDTTTGSVMNKMIWWEDDDGIYHDGTPELSVDLRDIIDNVWIETSRKW